MKMKILAPAILAVLAAAPAFAQTQKPVAAETAVPSSRINAQTFVMTAASSDQFEIQSSELAKERSNNKEIQAFAEQMIKDHTASSEKMKSVLSASNTAAPAKMQLQAQHQSMLDELSAAKGDQFDETYLRLQTQAHNEAVKLFRTYSKSGDQAELVAFAKETLPILEKHLEHVKHLEAAK